MPAEELLKMSSGFVLWGGENYIADNIVKILLIWLLLLAGAGCFFYFSRRFYKQFAAQAKPVPPQPSPSVWRWIPMLLLFAGAMALRLYKLGLEPLDSQELSYFIKAVAAKNILMVFFAPFMASPHPPLFTLVMHLWGQLSDSLFYLRLPAAFFGAATVPVLYAWASRQTNHFVALAAALLLAISPLHIYFSQSVMPYSLLVLLIVATFYMHHRVLDEPNRRYRNILYATILAGGLLCHFSFFAFMLPLVFETLWTFWRSPKAAADWRRLLQFALILSMAGLVFAPLSIGLVVYFSAGLKAIMPIINQMHLFVEYNSIGEGLRIFLPQLAGFFVYGIQTTFGSQMAGWSNLLPLPFALLGLLWWNRSHRRLPWHLQIPVIAGFGFFIALGLSTLVKNTFFYFAMRRFMPVLPFLYLLLAYGLWAATRLPIARARRAFTYAFAVCALLAVVSLQALDLTQTLLTVEKADTNNAVAYLKRNLREGDAIAIGPYAFFESMFNFQFKRTQSDWMMTLGPGHWRRHRLWKGNKKEIVYLFYPLHNVYLSWNEVLENAFLQRVWLLTIDEEPYGLRELRGRGSVTDKPLYRAGFTLIDRKNYRLTSVSLFKPSPRRPRLDTILFGANDFAQARGFMPAEQVRTNKRLIVQGARVVFADANNIEAFTMEIEKYALDRKLDLHVELSTSLAKSSIRLNTMPGTTYFHIPIKDLAAAPGDTLTISFGFNENDRDLFPDCLTENKLVCGLYIYKMEVERNVKPDVKL